MKNKSLSLYLQHWVLGFCVCWMLGACGSRSGTSSGATSTTGSTTVTAADGNSSTVSCTDDSRVTAFTENMHVLGTSNLYTFTLQSSTPNPPANGTNAMVLQVTNTAGTALTDLTISLKSDMPDHGHSASVQPTVKLVNQAYQIDNIVLFMPGVWRMTFTAESADGAQKDTGVFYFCISG